MQVRNHPMSNIRFCTDPTVCFHFFFIFLERNGNGGVAQGGGLSAAPDSRRGEGHATARCVSAVSGGTVSVEGGGTVAGTVAQWVARQSWVVAQWEGTVTVGRHSGKVGRTPPAPVYRHDAGAPCQVCQCSQWWNSRKDCPQLRPRPGPGGARCTGAQQFWGV